MKTLMTLALGLLVMTTSQMAQAKCTPNDPQESCYRPPAISNYRHLQRTLFGKTFCTLGSQGQKGIGISDKGIVFAFASNWGAPDPTTYFSVGPKQLTIDYNALYFTIDRYDKATNELLERSDEYTYHRDTKVITSGDVSFSEAACVREAL